MWRTIKAPFVAYVVAGLRNNGIDMPMSEFLEYRHLRRVMQEILDNIPQQPASEDGAAEAVAFRPPPGSSGRTEGQSTERGRPQIAIAVAIILAGLLIDGTVLFVFRWEIATANGGQVYRLDRWTGEISECNALNARRLMAREFGVGTPYRCTPLSEAEADRYLSAPSKTTAP